MDKVYLEKEIIGQSLPYFENINEADEKWIWESVKKNIEDDKISYEQINEKAKEIFGQELTKQFPKEGTEYLKYNKEEDNYELINEQSDEQGALFLLNKIEKTKDNNGYEIEIVEYIEDYSPMLKQEPEDYIIIRNLNGEEISRLSGTSQAQEIETVKQNIDKLSTKKVILNIEDEKIYIRKVY